MSRPRIRKTASFFSSFFQFHAENALKRRLRRIRNLQGLHEFLDRKSGHERLLLVVAGHKLRLWPLVMPRVAAFVPADWDVCVCCPGVDPPELKALCEKQGWSYLHTPSNRLALAQNLAIVRHSKARSVVKMDEDIFLAKNTLTGLVSAMEECKNGPFRPGIVAPLLNVNGYSSRLLLEKIGRLEEFETRFGVCRQSCLDTPVWQNPEAARFLWEILSPFDASAMQLAQSKLQFSACPHRFSIGCFAIEREFWEAMQGFTVAPAGDLGVEEIDLATYCAIASRPILVAHHLLVGHAGFGHQMPIMEPWLMENADKLKI